MEIKVKSYTDYMCKLTKEDEITVRNYSEKNNCSLEEAINYLNDEDIIDIYNGDVSIINRETYDIQLKEK